MDAAGPDAALAVVAAAVNAFGVYGAVLGRGAAAGAVGTAGIGGEDAAVAAGFVARIAVALEDAAGGEGGEREEGRCGGGEGGGEGEE